MDQNVDGDNVNVGNQLHLESSVLADKFEFAFIESVETQFEEIMVAEAKGAGEQAADFPVDAFHLSTGEPGFVVAQDALGMAKEGCRHSLELPDAAGSRTSAITSPPSSRNRATMSGHELACIRHHHAFALEPSGHGFSPY